ncbi:MAG: Holliday junction resolvase RuvX [Anaerolineaceae bacterium]|nr:MAG: Holliday junction resolvase RuvX [Anaerolineaceae bacterium]
MKRGKLISIDHGIKRIGLAVCDELRIVARELTIIERRSRTEDFAQINALAERENAVGFIVGVPFDDSLPEGEHSRADTVLLWTQRLAETTDLPIDFWDETNTSHDAQALAKQKKRPITAHIDDLAARVILQRYIDAVRDGLVEDAL